MIDTPRGPTTEQLRARALCTCGVTSDGLAYHTQACPAYIAGHRTACEPRLTVILARPCLACNREQGERMCDLCQRLEEAEARS